MAGKRLSATMPGWVNETKQRQDACLRNSIQRLGNEVTEAAPVVTGNLRRSLLGSTAGMPSIRGETERFSDGPDQIALAVAGLETGDTFWMGYQVAYAMRVNYGFVGQDSLGRTYNQAGRMWVDQVAARWPAIVEAEAARLMG